MKKAITLLCYFVLSLPIQSFAQWFQATPVSSANLHAVAFAHADTVYAGGVNIFLRSINAGQSWTSIPLQNINNQPINGLTINDLHFFNAQNGVAVGVRANTVHTILRTTDGGQHWTVVLSENDVQGNTNGITRLDFVNNNQGWCIGSSGKIRRTIDGGFTWALQSTLADINTLDCFDFVNAQIAYLAGNQINGLGARYYKTTNGGASWTELRTGGPSFQDIAFVHPDSGFVAQGAQSFRVDDGSNFGLLLPIADNAVVRRFVFRNAQNGYILTDNSVRRTNNGGVFWEQTTFPNSSVSEMLDFNWANNAQRGVAVGKNGRIYYTNNAGGQAKPMAFFYKDPDFAFYCKDQLIKCLNTAPQGQWNSNWLVDGQFFSNAHDISISFGTNNSTHSILLILSNGFASDTFKQLVQIEKELDFELGDIEWSTGPTICAGNTTKVKISNPAVGLSYFFSQNDVVIAQQFAGNNDPIFFETPALQEDAALKVFANISTACGSASREATLNIDVQPFPNSKLEWSMPDKICVNGQARILVPKSEPNVKYWLVENNVRTVSDSIYGNGDTLRFLSQPLTQSVPYQVRASNDIGCAAWLTQPLPVNIDVFFLNVDTTHLYGIVNQSITINNNTEQIGKSDWVFGQQATPPVSIEHSPTLVYTKSGTYPYSYAYQSQSACQGNIEGQFQVFEPANALTGQLCWTLPMPEAIFGFDYILDAQVDPSGNIWTTGARLEALGFRYTMNLFLNKYLPSGALAWSKRVDPFDPQNAADYSSTYGISICFDEAGNAYLAGSYSADKANVLGKILKSETSFLANYSNGFLFKVNQDGAILWSGNFQANLDYQNAVPSSIVYHNNQIHLALRANGWLYDQPDGNVATNSVDSAAAWYIVLDKNGSLIRDWPIKESVRNSLLGFFHPELNTIFTSLIAHKSPRLKVSSNGKILIHGAFSGLSKLNIGNTPKIVSPLDSTFSAKNHFIATVNPDNGACENAFCVYGIQTAHNDFPAWETDEDGNILIGLSLNGSFPAYKPSLSIGPNFKGSFPDRSFVAKFTENGTPIWIKKHTDQIFSHFLRAPNRQIWALSRFDRVVGFEQSAGPALGIASNGQNDLLLSLINDQGDLIGGQSIGSATNEQPFALLKANSGNLGIISADNLNVFLNGPNVPFSLRIWALNPVDCPKVKANDPSSEYTWSISPNPFADRLVFKVNLLKNQYIVIRLIQADGRTCLTKSYLAQAGDSTFDIETGALPSGVYFFEWSTETESYTRKLVKE